MPVVGNTSLYEVKLFSIMHGQTMLNRFFYQSGVTPDSVDAPDVSTAFETECGPSWELAVSAEWDSTIIETDEVTSIQNFSTRAATIGVGALAGETVGPNIAMAIRLFRATKETRSGWKRIAGLVEANQADGVLTGGQIALTQVLGGKFQNTLTVSTQALFPVIVRKTYTGDPPVLNPASQWIYNIIVGATAQANATTQNTRKYGR